ncbi:MAG: AarF/ABC1/UbiB kinase family protein [Anaerolineae bacterium]|nr:AarF/ABC1/UbiB kinase family protein [Anaerolineae bacterium]
MSDKNSSRTAEEIQQDLHRQLGQVLGSAGTKPDRAKIDFKRYRKVRWFFIKTFAHVIWWDIVLNRPILGWFRTDPLPRWQKIARRFRELAVEMGGVLIKMGQFLSIRVDVLPSEVTSELAGLRDEVPPDRIESIVAQVEADFGRPIADIFEWFSPQPLGAASLAQAHLARLASGEQAVVKVLRPGIEVLVETDLAAIALAIRWLKFYKRISQRVDLDWLAREFTTITRNELDFDAEGHNAERIATDFADDTGVYVPQVYWQYSAPHTLTLENVAYIKIDDLAGIEAAGISRAEVAKKFYDIYLRQIFETNFVHVDPHPGNVFVKPLPFPEEIEAGVTDFAPSDPVPSRTGRPFQIAFVDFGMVAIIPERLRAALKEYAIGIGTRDAHRVVQSYANAGILLPGADLTRIEEATTDMFQRLWGVRMGQVKDLAATEMQYFLREYRDIVYKAPFQFPADMLFIMRAIGILSGMATNLDPNFDPWAETIPFAERLAADQLPQGWQEWLQQFVSLGQLALRLPNQVDGVLMQARQGNLVVQASLAPEARRLVQGIERAINRLVWMVVAVGLLLVGDRFYIEGQNKLLGGLLLLLAALAFLWGMLRR